MTFEQEEICNDDVLMSNIAELAWSKIDVEWFSFTPKCVSKTISVSYWDPFNNIGIVFVDIQYKVHADDTGQCYKKLNSQFKFIVYWDKSTCSFVAIEDKGTSLGDVFCV